MLDPEILDSAQHRNGLSAPFTVAIVDDPNDGDTKLVVMFEGEGQTAVLSLNKLIEEEDIAHSHVAEKLDEYLRPLLWEK